MGNLFSLDKLETPKDFEVNSLIMEMASDNAEKLTEKDCELNGITCYVEVDDEMSFTDKAQDIFNVYYDEQVDSLYNLVNEVLKINSK